MVGNLDVKTDSPAITVGSTIPDGLNQESGYFFKNYQEYYMGKIAFNETEEWLGFMTFDGTGSAIPKASAYLKKSGLMSATNRVPIDPEDLTSKEYVDGNFANGSWSFDGTILDIVMP